MIQKIDRSRSVELAADVLMVLASTGACGVRDLARRCSASTSTVGRILASLETTRLVGLSPETHLYSLGPAAAWLGEAYLRQNDLVQQAYPVMRNLFAAVGETVSLHTAINGSRIAVKQIEATQDLRWAAQLGRAYPLHAGAASKVLLAHMDDGDIENTLARPLEKYTASTISDPARLRKELAKIRRQGYAVGTGERDGGAVGVAAPLFGRERKILGCLGVAGPESRLSKVVLTTSIVPALLKATNDIGARLGAPSTTAIGRSSTSA